MTDMEGALDGPEQPDPLVGRTLAGRYRVERLLGRGGMGAVYAGEHLRLHKPIAIKVILGPGLVNPELAISHRFPLKDIHKAVEVMSSRERNKVIVNP